MSQSGRYAISGGGGGSLNTLTGNTGGAINPAAGNINVVGAGNITVAGNALTHTLTISESGTAASNYTADSGTASPIANNINILGDTININTSAAGDTINVNLDNAISLGIIPITVGDPALEVVSGDVVITSGNLKIGRTALNFATGGFLVADNNHSLMGFDGNGNLYFGESSGVIQAGLVNTVFGNNSGGSLTTGQNNTFVGSGVGPSITTGGFNTLIGEASGLGLVTGSANICLGKNAGANLGASDSANILIGNDGISGDNNIIRIGGSSIVNCEITGIVNVDLSTTSLVTLQGNRLGNAELVAGDNINVTTAPSQIVVALTSGITVNDISIPFVDALTGYGIIYIGNLPSIWFDDVQLNWSCAPNTYNGNYGSDVTGTNNVALSWGALEVMLFGSNNLAIGTFALASAGPNSGSVADGNIAIGNNALVNLLAGTDNISIGLASGSQYTTTEANNITIGSEGVTFDSGVIRIGTNGTQTSCYIAGIDAVDVGSVATVVTEAGDKLGTATITAGSGITVTPTANTITISATGTTGLNYTNVDTTPYTVLLLDSYLSVDCSGGPISILLPDAAPLGQVWTIKDRTGSAATNNITITTVSGTDLIDGATTFVMNAAYESVNVVGNSANYEVF